MRTVALGSSSVPVPNVVLGCMRIGSLSDAEIRTLVATALDEGVTVFDHADIYGATPHECEERFGSALAWGPAEREQVVIQSKCGIRSGGWFDFSAAHILQAVDESLHALRTDYLDVLLLHRPDALVEPEEVAAAFDELAAAGKVRHFGVSNHSRGQLELLRATVDQPLVANQLQLSITHCPIVAEGVALNMSGSEQSVQRTDGILDYCRLTRTTIQAWSPFQKGFFDGVFLGDPEFPELNEALQRIAARYSVTDTAIAVGWITRHPANIQVVLGTTTPQRVRDSAAGSEIPLTRTEWYELFRLAGHIVP